MKLKQMKLLRTRKSFLKKSNIQFITLLLELLYLVTNISSNTEVHITPQSVKGTWRAEITYLR